MDKSIQLLKRWHISSPKKFQCVSPLSDINRLFSIREKEMKLLPNQLEFLKQLQQECVNCLSVDPNGSGRYFFRAGKSILEIFIFIEEDIVLVKPFLLYDEELIQQDIQRIIHKEHIIYSMLKKWGLQ